MPDHPDGEAVNVCPRCHEPVVFTFEFAGAEYYCVGCHWQGGVFAQDRAAVTPALLRRQVEVEDLYEIESAARQGREPHPAPSQDGSRPTCSGCGKIAEGRLEGGKPAHWYARTVNDVTEYACSRACITDGGVLPW